ncbi:UMP kinase [Candidatus Bathyarchaeota archaeon]|nr:MAG: UMP kinase [Candidatus Bathyarchaeota archaeon]
MEGLGRLKIVIKLGKFLFTLPLQPSKLGEYVEMIKKMVKDKHRVLIVVGGGEIAREYIKTGREAGLDESTCDQLGIETSKINAYLLVNLLEDYAYPEIPENLKELKRFFGLGKVVVMGGLTPGHSTTAVGALAAETVKADMYIIATDVDGIYTKDPKIFKDAKKFEVISTNEAFKLAVEGKLLAGTYELDPLAIKIIERSKIPTYFIDGRKIENFFKVLAGEKVGTYIKSSGSGEEK